VRLGGERAIRWHARAAFGGVSLADLQHMRVIVAGARHPHECGRAGGWHPQGVAAGADQGGGSRPGAAPRGRVGVGGGVTACDAAPALAGSSRERMASGPLEAAGALGLGRGQLGALGAAGAAGRRSALGQRDSGRLKQSRSASRRSPTRPEPTGELLELSGPRFPRLLRSLSIANLCASP